MAQLTLTFQTTPGAVFYRIKYRKTGTTTYTTTTATASPVAITNGIACGYSYEGTIEAICQASIVCYNYTIYNPDMYVDGDVYYTDCEGNDVSQVVGPGASFTVCARTVPVVSSAPSATVTQGSICGEGEPEEGSGPVPWSATAVVCPTYYYLVTPCDVAAPLPPNSEVQYDSELTPGSTVVELTGAGYAGYYYAITDVGGPETSTVLVATVYPNSTCNQFIP